MVFCCFQPQASQDAQGSEQRPRLTGTGDSFIVLLLILSAWDFFLFVLGFGGDSGGFCARPCVFCHEEV